MAGHRRPPRFRKNLNALCASAEAFYRDLPRLQRSQHLSADELAARASQEGGSFRSSVARLTPPSGLSAADHALVAGLDSQAVSSSPSPVTATIIAKLEKYDGSLLNDYTALGATGCEAYERQAIATLRAASQQSPQR
jgi:hypothetical protein